MNFTPYPLQFVPILKERIWGGTKLKSLFHKEISSKFTGESWELSTVENDISIILNGHFKNQNINDLIKKFPNEILGKKVFNQFGLQFPLLFKYIDAQQDLSVQLHPNDALAKKRHNSFGKTEMWYVIQADDDARLIVGFKKKSNPEEYLNHIKEKTLVSILEEIPVKKGDVFYLETGTIHAIGAGIVIAEIQQTSDITYRVYDFDRKDADGNARELHIDLALEAINYDIVTCKIDYLKEQNQANKIINSPYFTTNFIALNGEMNCINDKDSFVVYMCTEGCFKMEINKLEYNFTKGETVLLPAVISDYQLSGKATLLEIHL